MTRKALIEKSKRKPKHSTRKVRRCIECGRSRGKVTENLCRLSFRKYVYQGREPGWKKVN